MCGRGIVIVWEGDNCVWAGYGLCVKVIACVLEIYCWFLGGISLEFGRDVA